MIAPLSLDHDSGYCTVVNHSLSSYLDSRLRPPPQTVVARLMCRCCSSATSRQPLWPLLFCCYCCPRRRCSLATICSFSSVARLSMLVRRLSPAVDVLRHIPPSPLIHWRALVGCYLAAGGNGVVIFSPFYHDGGWGRQLNYIGGTLASVHVGVGWFFNWVKCVESYLEIKENIIGTRLIFGRIGVYSLQYKNASLSGHFRWRRPWSNLLVILAPGGGVKLLQVFYIGIVWYGFLGVFLSGQGLSLPVCDGATCTGDCSTSVKPHSIITPHSIIELLFYVITCPIWLWPTMLHPY